MGKAQSSNVNNVDRQCKSGYNFFFEGYFAVVVFFANEKQQQQYKNCINRQKIVKNLGLIFGGFLFVYNVVFFVVYKASFWKNASVIEKCQKTPTKGEIEWPYFLIYF